MCIRDSYITYPGRHTAMVQLSGYVSQTKEFTVEEGKTADLLFILKPSTETAPAHTTKNTTAHATLTQRSRSYLVPGIAIGAGVSLTLLGSVLLYHGPHDSERYEYTRATAVGLPIGLIGLGAIGLGLYVLWRAPDVSAQGASTAPKAVV